MKINLEQIPEKISKKSLYYFIMLAKSHILNDGQIKYGDNNAISELFNMHISGWNKIRQELESLDILYRENGLFYINKKYFDLEDEK
jgi:hypothetical protein